ncbi:MerR family DNA-binding transcriptional regulator, partial [Streptomyces sp. NPDC004561]
MSDATEAAGLTTGAVARRLGVSPTTLRSWDRRYGLGPASRSQGRHRRWSPRDVAMVEETPDATPTTRGLALEDRQGGGLPVPHLPYELL